MKTIKALKNFCEFLKRVYWFAKDCEVMIYFDRKFRIGFDTLYYDGHHLSINLGFFSIGFYYFISWRYIVEPITNNGYSDLPDSRKLD